MVIEYFATQAAEDAPATDLTWDNWDKHMWLTCYKVSLAIERMVNIRDWAVLVNAAFSLQDFDRNPAGYLFDRGEDDTAENRDEALDVLRDVLSASIDTVFNTSKAA
jgi:hypothetical protein